MQYIKLTQVKVYKINYQATGSEKADSIFIWIFLSARNESHSLCILNKSCVLELHPSSDTHLCFTCLVPILHDRFHFSMYKHFMPILHGAQKTAWGNQFSSSTMWVPGIKQNRQACWQGLHLLSLINSPGDFLLFFPVLKIGTKSMAQQSTMTPICGGPTNTSYTHEEVHTYNAGKIFIHIK